MSQRVDPDSGRKSYNHPCLIAQALDVLGDRWTLLILRDLMSGLHRYTEILENCVGMSPNVLSDRLKRLEAEALITRLYERGLPPRVEYNLTPKGWAVRPILLALLDFSREHVAPADSRLEDMPVDFAVRVVPAFSFQPGRAGTLSATLAIEIADCADCNRWTFQIADGHIMPRRHGPEAADVVLRTTTKGFFMFIRGEAPASACGEIQGSVELAAAVQGCFLPVAS